MTLTAYRDTVTRESSLTVIDCAECGIVFGIGAEYAKRRRNDGRTFYCPNGHNLSWHETEADRLRKQLAAAKELTEWERQSKERARAEARRKDYEARAAKGQLTKAKKRIAAGVCPCCNRTFQNLARHMEGQHPEYVGQRSTDRSTQTD